jgi:hypothetical protein
MSFLMFLILHECQTASVARDGLARVSVFRQNAHEQQVFRAQMD